MIITTPWTTLTTEEHGSGGRKINHDINSSISIPSNSTAQSRWTWLMGSCYLKKTTTYYLSTVTKCGGGIGIKPEGSVKLVALHSFMQEVQVDITALTECNVAWSQVDWEQYSLEQTKFWWENSHWLMTHNQQETHALQHQWGGMGIVVMNQLSYWAPWPGDNKMGLGRWCWARLHGKHDQYLRIVSVYQPCSANGPLSTYQQQVRFWSKSGLLPARQTTCGSQRWNKQMARCGGTGNHTHQYEWRGNGTSITQILPRPSLSRSHLHDAQPIDHTNTPAR